MIKIFCPPTLEINTCAIVRETGEVDIHQGNATWTQNQVPEGWVEMEPKWAPGVKWEFPNVPVGNPGVHGTHCCPRHGCKYGAPACPVKSGELAPVYGNNNGCDQCEFEAEESVAESQEGS
jgi:hypothetical protein